MCASKNALLCGVFFSTLVFMPSFVFEGGAEDDLFASAQMPQSKTQVKFCDLNGADTSTGRLTFAVYFGRPYYYAPYEYYYPYQPSFYRHYYPYKPYHFYYGW